jgi:hypothetical protein
MAWNVTRGSGSCVYVDEADEVVSRPCMPRVPLYPEHPQMDLPVVKDFVETDYYKEDVHATLSNSSLGKFAFTRETLGFDPNTCVNHTTESPPATFSQAKYCDEMYDYMVRISKNGVV